MIKEALLIIGVWLLVAILAIGAFLLDVAITILFYGSIIVGIIWFVLWVFGIPMPHFWWW